MLKKYCFLLTLSFTIVFQSGARQTQQADKMKWFADAKLGIFIHWGIYSVNGVSESWSFFNNYLSHESYMKQLTGFHANQYNPEAWAALIAESGAKYTVITAKHHDGVSLWDSKAMGAITTLNHSAARRDLLTPFVNAIRRQNLKTGLYFSLPDWSYPDYDVFTSIRKRYQLTAAPERWQRFQSYLNSQLEELNSQYRPDLFWFDGDWEHHAAEWNAPAIRAKLLQQNPSVILNSRLNSQGDYDTPEQGIPVKRPASKFWELCYTMNDSWGYQEFDRRYKTPNMIIRTLIDCISMGGNLLLDIGPKADGTIPDEQVRVLKALGRWTKKHGEAIFGSQAGISENNFRGKTTRSADGRKVYLFLDRRNIGQLTVYGTETPLRSARVIGYAGKITFKKNGSQLTIDVPAAAEDADATVVELGFDTTPVFADRKPGNLSLVEIAEEKEPVKQIAALSSSVAAGYNPFPEKRLEPDGIGFEWRRKDELAAWIKKHAEALYKTGKGLPFTHYDGESALSADKRTLYLFVKGQPTGPIAVKGLQNTIQRVRIVGQGTMLPHEIYNKLYWSKTPGIVYIDIPAKLLDPQMTVVALLLDGPATIFTEDTGAIQNNL
ncbi:alpha-L-fucosidase [Pedobacter yulinensis]|uniref:alpha-L-fucosidase n=1 Tax=Pedobacter yulinensis TaxID=2126353 RepID=A0A2T3HN66_9SPHI|nr:alpha-L-fucosidase [Pedobacter yulinensis]PST83869.1 alpha-L-fucosidase [Pedobacter yulinensis]